MRPTIAQGKRKRANAKRGVAQVAKKNERNSELGSCSDNKYK